MKENIESQFQSTAAALDTLIERFEVLSERVAPLLKQGNTVAPEPKKPVKKSRFEQCLEVTLKHEGGWSDHPDDPGGATMKGITLNTYQEWARRKGWFPRPVALCRGDLRIIPEDHLRCIYREGYWNVIKADAMPPGVDLALFDYAVNSGPVTAVMDLQRACNMGRAAFPHIRNKLAQDGQVGPLTLQEVWSYTSGWMVDKLCEKRLQFVRELSTWDQFGNGWTRRIANVRVEAMRMISEGQDKK